MSDYSLTAKSRDTVGKGASRRLRRLAEQVPAIIYGGKKSPQNVSITHKDFVKALENEGFYSQIIQLTTDGSSEDVILKDIQRHPAKPVILHADFLRIDKTQKLNVRVPLHFINEDTSVGVKMQGGIVSHIMTELEVNCLPADLPEFIEVDMAEVEVDSTVHISDLSLPKGVESVALAQGSDHDLSVAAIHVPKEVSIDDPVDAEGTEDGEDADGDKAE